MKKPPEGEAQANNSDPTLPVLAGSHWDACSENSLAVDGLAAIPYETLEASGIPRDVADRLNYRNLTPADVEDALGYPMSGCWGIKYTNPDGSDVLVDGKPFIRVRRPDGSTPKYLTRRGAGNRVYFSPLLKPAVLDSSKPLMVTEGEKCADSAIHHGFPCIGLAGVYSWKDKAHPNGLPELLEINFKYRDLLIVFDSDIHTNSNVQEAMFQLAELVCWRKATPKVVALPCELDGRKNGVDDFLFRHGADALQRLIDIAKVAGELVAKRDGSLVFRRLWEPEQNNAHLIAAPLSTVMKETYADNPEVGIHIWHDSHWSRLTGKRSLHPPTHHWMDRMGFHTRGDGRINTIVHEVQDYLEVRNWDNPNLTAFTNGTYDVDRDVLLPGHRQEDWLTHCFPFDRDPSAKCPRFLVFLGETFKDADGVSDPAAVTFCVLQFGGPFAPRIEASHPAMNAALMFKAHAVVVKAHWLRCSKPWLADRMVLSSSVHATTAIPMPWLMALAKRWPLTRMPLVIWRMSIPTTRSAAMNR